MKISIITASYNYADYIEKAINSILAQTYENWELIIVDDGSQDNSVEIIKKYAEKYENISFYQHENGVNKGLSKTLQLGLTKASGEYIAFLESDDYWAKNHLEEKVKVLQKNPKVKFIFNDVNLFGDKNSITSFSSHFKITRKYLSKAKNSNNYLLHYFFIINLVPSFSSVLVKSKTLKKCNFDTPIDALLDWWLWIQISARHKLYYLDQKLTYWMLHPSSYLNTSAEVHNKEKFKMFFKQAFKQVIFKKGFIPQSYKLYLCYWKLICLKIIFIPRINKLFRTIIRKVEPFLLLN